jgi:hypothetical protein
MSSLAIAGKSGKSATPRQIESATMEATRSSSSPASAEKSGLPRRILLFEAAAGTQQGHEHNGLTKRAAILKFLTHLRCTRRPSDGRRVQHMRRPRCDGDGYTMLGESIRQGWTLTQRG